MNILVNNDMVNIFNSFGKILYVATHSFHYLFILLSDRKIFYYSPVKFLLLIT